MPSSAVVQLRFDSVDRIGQVIDTFDYYLGLPLPGEVAESEVHRERYEVLKAVRGVFNECLDKYRAGEAASIGPHFGSGGSVQVGPPEESER